MRSKFTILFISFFLFIGNVTSAQTDTNSKHLSADSLSSITNKSSTERDDDFTVFLLVFAMVAISLMIGCAIVGALAAISLLFLLAAFISFGILSVSILAGLYKRSVTTGFKTFVYIVCPLMGVIAGLSGFWIIINLFKVSISNHAGLLAGAIGGLLGGLLMAVAVSKITIVLTKYLWGKFSQTDSDNR